MFISHLQTEQCERKEIKNTTMLPSAKEDKQLSPLPKARGSFRRECAYRFEALNHLLHACKRLQTVDCICESSAYCDENRVYFLIVTVYTSSPFSTPDALDPITEYGIRENEGFLRIYIREHAKLIASPNAIGKLGALAP